MSSSTQLMTHNRRGLRLDTLTRLRWMAVIGQSIAIFVVGVVLSYPMPILACTGLITLSAFVNILIKFRYKRGEYLSCDEAASFLGFDILQLSGMVALTGGLNNPFIFMGLVPVIVSAATLRAINTVVLGLLAMTCASIISYAHLPLPWDVGDTIELPKLYILGVWLALFSSMVFMSAYTFKVAQEARNLQAALSATELVLAHEQHLSDLDGMAAAAAHELGTPLSTIVLAAKEMALSCPKESPLTEDIDLIKSQASRCRTILSKLASLEDDKGSPTMATRISTMIEEIITPHRLHGVNLIVEHASLINKDAAMPLITRNPAILYGLGNFIENAVDFANDAVTIVYDWSDTYLEVIITDDGPGFSDYAMRHLGEPYMSQRSGKLEQNSGMGLGVFIAKTLLERSGASITFDNATDTITGAKVTVRWPLNALEIRVEKTEQNDRQDDYAA